MLPRSNPCTCTKETLHNYLADRLEFWIWVIEYIFLRDQEDPWVEVGAHANHHRIRMGGDLLTLKISEDYFRTSES